jgi:hypothetical protein
MSTLKVPIDSRTAADAAYITVLNILSYPDGVTRKGIMV